MKMRREMIISEFNEFGMKFSIIPSITLDMDAGQIKAELQLANQRLDELMINWKKNVKIELNAGDD